MNIGPKLALVAGLLVLSAGAGWYFSMMLGGKGAPQHALMLPEPVSLPEFRLTGGDGVPITRDSLAGQWTLVFFGFTHCPDICPATLQQLAAARQQLADGESTDSLPEILLVSVDPERDTPETLVKYTTYFGEGVSGATGELTEIEKLTSAIGIFFRKEATENGDYMVAHSAQVIVIDDDGKYRAVFSAPHSVDAFVDDLPKIMDAM